MKLFQNNWIAMKDAFRSLFDELNIKKVVYVDNEFEIEVYKENLLSFLRDNINSTAIEWPFSVEAGIEFAIDNCERWAKDIDKRIEVIQFLQTHKIQKSENATTLSLNGVFPDDFLIYLTPSEFTKEHIETNILTPSKTSQLLILMDKNLEGNEELDGMKLLRPFINQQYVRERMVKMVTMH